MANELKQWPPAGVLGAALSFCICNQRAMRKPCSERDRLGEAYYQAMLEASRLSGVLESIPVGPEFSAGPSQEVCSERAVWIGDQLPEVGPELS
jgi:hypothetical protein